MQSLYRFSFLIIVLVASPSVTAQSITLSDIQLIDSDSSIAISGKVTANGIIRGIKFTLMYLDIIQKLKDGLKVDGLKGLIMEDGLVRPILLGKKRFVRL